MSEYIEYVLDADEEVAQRLFEELEGSMEISSPEDVTGEHGIGARTFYGVIVPAVERLKNAGLSVELSIYQWTCTKTQIV